MADNNMLSTKQQNKALKEFMQRGQGLWDLNPQVEPWRQRLLNDEPRQSVSKTTYIHTSYPKPPLVKATQFLKPVEGILPQERGPERLLPIGPTLEQPSGDPYRLLNRKRRVFPSTFANRRVFYWTPDDADWNTNRSALQVSEVNGKTATRKRMLSGPADHLVVKGFDGGAPALPQLEKFSIVR